MAMQHGKPTSKKERVPGTETTPEKKKYVPKKKECPISLADFRKGAKPLMAVIAGQNVAVPTKEFSTGSFGWYAFGKLTMEVDGVPVEVQLGLNLTIVGSKNAPDGE